MSTYFFFLPLGLEGTIHGSRCLSIAHAASSKDSTAAVVGRDWSPLPIRSIHTMAIIAVPTETTCSNRDRLSTMWQLVAKERVRTMTS